MNLIQGIIDFVSNGDLISFFLKLFGIALSALFIFLQIITSRQVVTMKKTVQVHDHNILNIVSLLQLIGAVLLFLYALFIL